MKNHKYIDENEILYQKGELYHIFLCEKSNYFRSKIDYYSKSHPDSGEIKCVLLINRTDKEEVIFDNVNLDIRDPTNIEVLLWFNNYLKYVNYGNQIIKESTKNLKEHILNTLEDDSKNIEVKDLFVSDHFFLIKELMVQDDKFSKSLEKYKDLLDTYTII